ncbi:hypothetical protein [Mucilaginibacter aquaedulcis]|uniref:hypothetical protein n=1 Tax=Mucilaginibacter aquaedulcis TaxID=1187081 RepID=UPI0025B3085B|nr:hypothetical protein [Mucilaginibacter aquaedulcis]MDN3550721.1 hypothetical protein [Mucilaginibacter aquaedulcis]
MEGQFTISSIIIIVWLIFPGVVFKRFYFQGQFAKQFGVGLFADRLITSIFWGIIVQIITFLFYSRSFGFTFTGIKGKINTIYTNIASNKMPDITYQHLTYILGYLACLIFVAFFLGSFFHFLIRILKIDVKVPVFRFSNHWNYYFRGEIVSMREFKSLNKGKWLSTMVDVVIEDGSEKNKMVSGFLTQHTISQKTGDLETIYLTGAKRYSQSSGQFKEVPGDCLVIPFEKVVDLNLRYTFQVIDINLRRRILFQRLVLIILTFGLLFILIFPWYLKRSIFYRILGIVFGGITWLLFIMIASNPFQPNPRIKLEPKHLWPILIFMIAFLIFTIYFLGIIPSMNQIKNIF